MTKKGQPVKKSGRGTISYLETRILSCCNKNYLRGKTAVKLLKSELSAKTLYGEKIAISKKII